MIDLNFCREKMPAYAALEKMFNEVHDAEKAYEGLRKYLNADNLGRPKLPHNETTA